MYIVLELVPGLIFMLSTQANVNPRTNAMQMYMQRVRLDVYLHGKVMVQHNAVCSKRLRWHIRSVPHADEHAPVHVLTAHGYTAQV